MIEFDFLPLEVKTFTAIAFIFFTVAVCFFIYFFYYYQQGKDLVVTEDNRLHVNVAYFHEVGKRAYQEDSFYISSLDDSSNGVVACVSDGMGGLKYGDIVSKYIVDKVESWFPIPFFAPEDVANSIRKLSNAIYAKYSQSGGATLAMVHIMNCYMNYYSVGDSNIILIRDGFATIINQKQNYLHYLVTTLIKQGTSTHAAYSDPNSRALTDFVGNHNPCVNYSSKPIRLMDGDTIIVCSDGVTDTINWKSLPKYVEYLSRNTAFNIKQSVRLNKNPRQDNYTAVVIKVQRSQF